MYDVPFPILILFQRLIKVSVPNTYLTIKHKVQNTPKYFIQ
eukprot:UN07784